MNIIKLQAITPIFQQKKVDLPERIEFTKTEQEFIPVLRELTVLECNIETQRQNLRDYYSSQDRSDYRELLKKKRGLTAKLKRIAQKDAVHHYEMEVEIKAKREYNRFAPKIIRAKTPQELQKVIDLMSTYTLYVKVKEMLAELIRQKKF